ncbi:MAG: GntR family transcriptional regulator [Verrucomicrobia bacterium]|nr:GntR family transcriptional regulator [Verrucomicrobiota bacterium]MBI3868201.1 GntR family transcriptional regulator [Verrucomicrobiota bacterium]
MTFELNYRSGKPVYLQMVDQVKSALASGALKEGDSLPAIRPLAEELRVNRNTVAKAYGELEREGIIETLAGKGCFICRPKSPLRRQVRVEMLTREIDESVVAAHHLQIPRDAFLDLSRDRFDAFEKRRVASDNKAAAS